MLDIIEKKDRIVLQNVKDFFPPHIFECGQCFRWDLEEDGSYTGVVFDKVLNISVQKDSLILKNTNVQEVEDIWIDYFDLKTNYSKIKKDLAQRDSHLKAATKFGHGMRILKQPFHETVISFIISARNSLGMIKRSVNYISQELGEHIDTYAGKKYYSFPSMQVLAKVPMPVLAEAKTAFRAPYISKTAQMIVEEKVEKADFLSMDLEQTRKKLMNFPGVGPKVADCIALFALQKYDAFPVDRWVKRVMEEFYLGDKTLSLAKMRQHGIETFGQMGGYAQQYLFYYFKELALEKKER